MQLYRKSGWVDRLEEARQAAERGRARNLLDVLSAAGIGPAPAGEPQLTAREQQLRRDLGELSAKRASLLRGKSAREQVAAAGKQIDGGWTENQGGRSEVVAAGPRALFLAEPAAGRPGNPRRQAPHP